eukprot:1997521-Amphidinium_carterae.1
MRVGIKGKVTGVQGSVAQICFQGNTWFGPGGWLSAGELRWLYSCAIIPEQDSADDEPFPSDPERWKEWLPCLVQKSRSRQDGIAYDVECKAAQRQTIAANLANLPPLKDDWAYYSKGDLVVSTPYGKDADFIGHIGE